MTQATAGRERPAQVHVQQRDIDGLVMCGEHGGVPYDLLGMALGVPPARLRGPPPRPPPARRGAGCPRWACGPRGGPTPPPPPPSRGGPPPGGWPPPDCTC